MQSKSGFVSSKSKRKGSSARKTLAERLKPIEKELKELYAQRDDLQTQWEKEKDTVEAIRGRKVEIEELKHRAADAERRGRL